MIYRATWEDGREAMIRASDEERARIQAREWRLICDPEWEADKSPTTPKTIEHVQSRGPAEILTVGWMKESPPDA